MMHDYEYAFVQSLIPKIKEKIKVGVVAEVKDDVLEVKLFRDHEVDFIYKVDDFYNKIREGYAAELCARAVYNMYMRKIIKRYFH